MREEAQDNYVRTLEAETEEEEARRIIAAKKAARSEPIMKWRDLPEELFKITEVKEFEGKWGKSQILTLDGGKSSLERSYDGGNTLEERCDRGIDKYGFLSRACL